MRGLSANRRQPWAYQHLEVRERSQVHESRLRKKRLEHQVFPGIQAKKMFQGAIMSNVDIQVRWRTGISLLVNGLQAG